MVPNRHLQAQGESVIGAAYKTASFVIHQSGPQLFDLTWPCLALVEEFVLFYLNNNTYYCYSGTYFLDQNVSYILISVISGTS